MSLYLQLSCCVQEHSFIAGIYLLLFFGDPWAQRAEDAIHVLFGAVHFAVSYSLHIGQLWVSVTHHPQQEASLWNMGDALI